MMLNGKRNVGAGACEALELRRLLAADLIAALPGYSLPGGATAGSVMKGSATVGVSNRDAAALPASAKKVTVQVVLRPAGTSGAGDVVIGKVKNVSVAGLKKGAAAKQVVVPLNVPKGVAAGTFSVVAVVDSTNVIAESNEGNNIKAAKAKYPIKSKGNAGGGGAGADLTVSEGKATLTPDGSVGGRYTAKIKNIGTAKSSRIVYEVVAIAPGQPDQVMNSSGPFNGTLAAGQTLQLFNVVLEGIKNRAPVQTTFQVVLRITGGDNKTANNVKQLGTITLAGRDKFPAPSNAANPLTAKGIGTTLTFTANNHTESGSGHSLEVYEDGTVTDGLGKSGTYVFRFKDGMIAPTVEMYFGLGSLHEQYRLDFGYGVGEEPPTFATLAGRPLTLSTVSNEGAIVRLVNVNAGQPDLFVTG